MVQLELSIETDMKSSLVFNRRFKASCLTHTEGTTMPHAIHDVGVAAQIGSYSDSLEIAPNLRWLITSGTPGLSVSGAIPSDITGQSELAWNHISAMLRKARMDVADIVKVTQYLLRPEDVAAYARVRNRYLGAARPASMLLVIPQLVRPEFLVEVAITAARAAT